jgi:hypothetical protein
MHGVTGNEKTGINKFKAPFFDGSQPCAQTDPDLFFPNNAAEGAINIRYTRKICKSCEFKSQCLEYALTTPLIMGVWAGTTEHDRVVIRRQKRNSKR